MEITDIKKQLTIQEVLQYYGLKADKNNRVLCPFHNDTVPSMQIYPRTDTYCCFSANCTAGTGDVIEFIRLKENSSKHEAIIKAQTMINGYRPEQIQGATNTPVMPVMAKEMVLSRLYSIFGKGLEHAKKAQQYLQDRGLAYQSLEAGYNAGTWQGEKNNHHLIASCMQLGLLKPNTMGKGNSPWAKGCIIFPLKNIQNKIVSLYGRSIANDKDSRHYYLKDRSGLYPCYPGQQTKKLILTESIIDAASLLQQKEIAASYTVLALYGTNGLTQEHLSSIQSLQQLKEIIFMLDGDAAGNEAVTKHSATLKQILPVITISKVTLPEGEDINSVLCNHDDAGVLLSLINARTGLYFSNGEKNPEQTDPLKMDAVLQSDLNTSNAELLIYNGNHLRIEILGGIKITGLDRLKVTLKITHLQRQLLPIRHSFDLYNRVQTEQLIQTISDTYDINIKQVESTIGELTGALENYRLQRMESMQVRPETKPVLTEKQRQQAINELQKENLLDRHNKMIGMTGVTGEEKNRMIAYLIYTVRKTQTPLQVMFLGVSGSGKTYLQERISELMPEEDKIEITQITENALYYFREDELQHKIIIFEDLDGALQVFYPMRELQTKKRISKRVTIKDSKGTLKTIEVKVNGPVCISGCTTKEKLYEDNANRCILLYIDTGKEQDKKIMDYHAAVESGEIDIEKEQHYKELFKNIQRVLKPVHVNNPYSKYITLPEAVFKPRRTITLLRGFIKAIAYYHQYQREIKQDKNGQPYIDVTIKDIEQGFYYMQEVLFSKSDELAKATRGFLEQLKQLSRQQGSDTFNGRAIREQLRMNPGNLKRYLAELVRYGYIKPTGNRYRKGSYEYTIVDMGEYEALKSQIEEHLQDILQTIRENTLPKTVSSSVVQ